MELKAYERIKFANNLRPLLIKDKCECCGETDKLHLHHDKQFAEMLKETLDRLGYEYKLLKEDYTKEQLENITDMLLGIHIKSTYTTLCENCHNEIHKDGELVSNFLRNKNKFIISNDDIKSLDKYLSLLLNIKLLKEEQIKIREFLSNESYKIDRSYFQGRTMQSNTFNKIMKEIIHLPYEANTYKTSKRVNGKVVKYSYWIINKINK